MSFISRVPASGATKDSAGATLTTDTLAYAAAVGVGNFLLLRARIGNGIAHTITVSDSVNAGNWVKASNGFVSGNCEVVIFYKENTLAGTPTVTISWTDAAASLRWEIAEYSGVAT